jgi:hypothetical protein
VNVYLLEIQRMGGEGEIFRQVLAIADNPDQARAHVLSKFTGWHVAHCAEVTSRPVHFVLAELEEE